MSRRILLLGGNGQVGWELCRALAPLGELHAPDRQEVDLYRPETLAHTVKRWQPDVIVNAAAYTAVDKAETEQEEARTLNSSAPAFLASEACRTGALLVHYSTDYVFDGSGNRPRTEAEPTAPLNVYGLTKLAGENAIRESGARHLIFRTSWVYASRGANFPRTILRLAQEKERLSVIDDQWGAPTGADLIADITAHAIRQALDAKGFEGTYHVAASGETSWWGYARWIIDTARAARPEWPWKVQSVEPIPGSEYPTPARRPANSRLDTSRLQQTFGLTLPEWQAGVQRLLAEIL
ncbi:MAG: dTDP-4-dehydrorhamnose reductase [Hydrogenophaga sp.]|uniref:dTDP-4-dehydrorhamnose reductase n=1 Tax=Hydrogenophaga sp. TaxID=1904254 RepID=UPI0027337B58|nr:dTDP-4-dehydrorhamnose reductase [Hydrogenophaga sp.]MDP3625775.1 dTDP-4-dehydrorhamnose reductase [Hydrogenophaga sp.]